MNSVGFPGSSNGKEFACIVGDLGSIPGLGRSPGEGNGYPLQNSGLENSIDCIVHGVSKSETQLINFHFMTEPQFYCTLLKSHLGPADATFFLQRACVLSKGATQCCGQEVGHPDFPGGPMVKNLPRNAGDVGLIPGWGTKILHLLDQLSLHTTISEPTCHNRRSRMS